MELGYLATTSVALQRRDYCRNASFYRIELGAQGALAKINADNARHVVTAVGVADFFCFVLNLQ